MFQYPIAIHQNALKQSSIHQKAQQLHRHTSVLAALNLQDPAQSSFCCTSFFCCDSPWLSFKDHLNVLTSNSSNGLCRHHALSFRKNPMYQFLLIREHPSKQNHSFVSDPCMLFSIQVVLDIISIQLDVRNMVESLGLKKNHIYMMSINQGSFNYDRYNSNN